MSAALTQMGPYLMSETLFNGQLGPIRKACRLDTEGAEFLTVQCIDTTLTAHDTFVHTLSQAVERAVKHPRNGMACPHELGVVGRQYFVAGDYPEGPTLNRILARCETLGSGVPIESALELTIRALEIVAHLHAQSKDIWHGHLDLDNIYLSDDGTLSLGWDGIRIAENPADRDWGQAILTFTDQLVQMLGRLAVASEDPDVPDRLSDWLRDALSPAGREKTPAVVQASLRSLGLASSGAMKPILDLFSREFAVINARQRHLKAEVESLPEGARRRIALTTSQTLVNYGRERRLTQVHSRPFTKRSDVLYEGEMGPMDCPCLLYRYSAAGVSGRLELDGPRGHTAIRFTTRTNYRRFIHPAGTLVETMGGYGRPHRCPCPHPIDQDPRDSPGHSPQSHC